MRTDSTRTIRRAPLPVLLCVGLALTACQGQVSGRGDGGDRAAQAAGAPLQINLANRHSLLCLGGGGAVAAGSCEPGAGHQAFDVLDLGQSLVQLRQRSSGKCLQWWQGALTYAPCNSSYHAQHWLFSRVDARTVTIKARLEDACLDSTPTLAVSPCNPGHWSQHWERIVADQHSDMQAPRIGSDCAARNTIRGWKQNGAVWEPDWWAEWIDDTGSRCSSAHPAGFPFIFWRSTEANGGASGGFWPLGQAAWSTRGQTFDHYYTANGDGTYTATLELDLIDSDDCSLASQSDSCPDCVCRSREYNIVELHEGEPVAGAQRFVSDNLMMDVELQVVSGATTRVKNDFTGSVRLGCGAIADDLASGTRLFAEVTVWTLGEVDGCPAGPSRWGPYPDPVCDPDGSYLRRSVWGSGEAYYIRADRVSSKITGAPYLPMLKTGGGWQAFRIPLSKLLTRYGWHRAPGDWGQVRLLTAGCMIESLGEARAEVRVRGLRVYATGK